MILSHSQLWIVSRAQVHFKYSWFLTQTHTHSLFSLIIQHLGAIHNNLKWIKLNNINDVLLMFVMIVHFVSQVRDVSLIENRGDCGVEVESL